MNRTVCGGGCGKLPSNGLALSRAALIDRGKFLAKSNLQNRSDLVDAQRRRLQRRVGRRGSIVYWNVAAPSITLPALIPTLPQDCSCFIPNCFCESDTHLHHRSCQVRLGSQVGGIGGSGPWNVMMRMIRPSLPTSPMSKASL